MPKREKQEETNEKENTGNKVLVGLLGTFMILFGIALLLLLIKMDVGGFGSSVLTPVLKDIPVVNKILPDNSSSNSNTKSSKANSTKSKKTKKKAKAVESSSPSPSPTASATKSPSPSPTTNSKDAKYQERVKELAATYSKMDAATAAASLETMTADLDLVSDILLEMRPAQSALIMDNMSKEFAAKITKKMSTK
ncbi:MotE family protein [Anaeromicropila herbilytica]|uniref:Magnesium transporter MgtE intracellular domain-containing protein n=1 Tax=Anaeromicropila herbilytica TaxID=2785025 RepID=A0A7R7EIP8_9FIRM|nr:hypothetical protein [Anaeromicropila herbilytica]BCN29416.1 hypothetical protein bsdtb5_07110 [Anaeromicropila herbilytica]